ncbi:DoxX family protein [Chitinophaga alhagiae]|uniref:DoxX family protein n=1 Tax=Chitinophaga alhagiae TaxID=2203219 RepID=A0ABM6W8K3_9BACT|nr:DoxX family protein [Chitinophaga alhagiae]AWO00247.1 DoxX family protein [Chitinophaga alhagiae]
MKKLLSARFSNGAVHLTQLVLRLVFGGLIAYRHGWPKLMNFSQYSTQFADPFGIGKSASLGLTVFAELFCGILLVLGLVTRLATIPLIICMSVIIFMIHRTDGWGKQEMPVLFLAAFVVILITGSGKYSIDSAIGK